jgi:oligopeptide/dipeptide ABC transporter ATP-binding protein
MGYPVTSEDLRQTTAEVDGDVVLRVEDLSVRFGDVRAVTNVSFEVRRGEFFGIVGESGSGKSVTAKAVLGLLPSGARISGHIHFEGQELLRLPPRQLRRVAGDRISMVFQDALAALDPVYTVGFQLVEALRAHQRVDRATARRRAVELLEEVGIPDPANRLDSYPHQLSGGQLQRVVIATALISDPEVILADEPTTALDVTVQKQILDLFREIQARRGMSIVLITHDLGVVAETCDRVAVFYGGIIAEEAPVLPIFEEPQHPYTVALLNSVPHLGRPSGMEGIPGSPRQIRGPLTECPFWPRCEHAVPECWHEIPQERRSGPHRHRCIQPWTWDAGSLPSDAAAGDPDRAATDPARAGDE